MELVEKTISQCEGAYALLFKSRLFPGEVAHQTTTSIHSHSSISFGQTSFDSETDLIIVVVMVTIRAYHNAVAHWHSSWLPTVGWCQIGTGMEALLSSADRLTYVHLVHAHVRSYSIGGLHLIVMTTYF